MGHGRRAGVWLIVLHIQGRLSGAGEAIGAWGVSSWRVAGAKGLTGYVSSGDSAQQLPRIRSGARCRQIRAESPVT